MRGTVVQKDFLKKLMNDSLLITGNVGSGKTTMIKTLIPELLDQGKRVCLIDFSKEYADIGAIEGSTYQDELSLEEMNSEDDLLFRVTFNKDILYFKEKCNLDFLASIINGGIDYLIVDEAQHLFVNTVNFDLDLLLNDPNLNLILALQTFESLDIEDVVKLQQFERRLMFHEYNNVLAYLKQGESILIENNQVIGRYYLNERRRNKIT